MGWKLNGGVALALLAAGCAAPRGARVADDGWIEARMREDPGFFLPYLTRAEELRLQILVSEIRPDGGLLRHGFRVDAEYLYPASTIKLCSAVAALQWLGEQRESLAVDLNTPLAYHPLFPDEVYEDRDDTNLEGGAITVGHEVRKLFLVSDNRAHNRLYELVGHRELNERMWDAGLPSVRSVHRLSEARSFEDNLRTPRIDFLGPGGPLHTVPERTSDLPVTSEQVPGHDLDAAFLRGDELSPPPSDFGRKNSISLLDLQNALILVARPDLDLGLAGFDLPEDLRRFALAAMSEQPADSTNPAYDADAYPPDRLKYLMPGVARVVPRERVTCFNKVGRAYGFTLDNAYVEHDDGRAFFVTAAIYTNPNRVLNDGVYAYRTEANPFFERLGEVVARALWGP